MTQRSAETFRLDEQHLEFIRMAGAAFDPPSDNKSFITRTLLTGLRALLMTRRMPRWMADLQEKLTVCADVSGCVQDSVALGPRRAEVDGRKATKRGDGSSPCLVRDDSAPSAEMPTGAIPDLLSASAAEAGRRDDALGVRAKRPPRRIRPTRVVRVAVRVSVLADASLFTPFYGLRRTFAIGA